MIRRPAFALATAAAILTGCGTTTDTAAADTVSLVAVPGGNAASSAAHGPFHVLDGRAAWFSHNALGAALAASHIVPRLTPAAGQQITMATLIDQCWGDLGYVRAATLAADPLPDAPPGSDTVPNALLYRVLSGDPHGAHVVISLLADTPQARASGGLTRLDATLRWHHSDWQLRVPTPAPVLHPDSNGYLVLAAAR